MNGAQVDERESTLDRYRRGTLPYVELRDLEVGMRFRFAAFEEEATLIEKGVGGAIIRYTKARKEDTREFEARDGKTGEKVKKVIKKKTSSNERCSLGAQVIPLEEA